MKLEKYVDKNNKKRKVILISLGTIALISVSLLLYKTFASFNEHVEFPIMNGKVDYFGNSDVYFAFYNGNEKLDSMPLKDNADGLLFSYGVCDNGASIEWNEEEWAPLVKNLSKSKTKCSLYFRESAGIEFIKNIATVESGDGLYKVEHNNLEELGKEWNKTEYRYAGVNPNNYVLFNDELWRVIGVVNAKTNYGIEQRIKIVRTNGINNQKDFGTYYWDIYVNSWSASRLKNMLNNIYYESDVGECFIDSNNASQCDFTGKGTLPKGLNEIAREMLDKNVIWNVGGNDDPNINAKKFYEKERGILTGNDNFYPNEWNSITNEGENFNGIGLIYPSDYSYSIGGNVRNICLEENLYKYNEKSCINNSWIKLNNDIWTITPDSSSVNVVFSIHTNGQAIDDTVYLKHDVWPALYLKSSVKILPNPNSEQEYGTVNNPMKLSY